MIPIFAPIIFLGSGEEPETASWVAEVVSNGGSVSAARRLIVNTLVAGLKNDGIWDKLDRLWLFAAENEESALTDLVALTLAAEVGAPTFTVDEGYAGADALTPSDYIALGFNPTVGTNKFVQNSAHMSVWINTNVAVTNGGSVIGTQRSNLFITFTDGNVYSRITESGALSGSQGAPGTRAGHWVITRPDSTHSTLYQDASVFSAPDAASDTLLDQELFALCSNDSGASRGNPNELSVITIGEHLSSTNITSLYDRIATYRSAIGL